MANWKKVLVSGSSIEVASITASVVPTNSSTSLRTLMVDPATGHIFRTGSYGGGGGGGSLEPLTDGNGIVDFSYDGGTATTVAVEADGATLTVGSGGVKVTDLGIGTGQLATDAVTTVKITDLNVTTGKLADDAVTTVKITDLNVTTGKLADDAVTTAKIAPNLGTFTGHSFTGSFTGSFAGDGSGLTGITGATTTAALTQGTGVSSFSFNGSTAATVSVAGASSLTNQKLVKWDDSAGTFVDSKIIEGTNLITIGAGTDEVKIPGDLRVQGTASFQNSTTLLVEDRYILVNSGSTSGNQGGIVIQTENTQNVGQLFGYNGSTSRWAIKSAFDAESTTDFNPQAYMGLTSGSAITNPNAAGASGVNETIIKQSGNIYVNNTLEEIWIYS
tara:strand:- start:3066 stop:4232 length:1167 start_codon:yes stop_codon:yes gene_type:complete